jgi:protein disulfide-isomerase
MESEVFSQPEVARQIQANYVPVKIDYDQNPDLATKYGVAGLPSDVILAPQGQVISVTKGKAEAGQYIAHLNQCSATVRQKNAGLLAALPTSTPAGNMNPPVGNTSTVNPPPSNPSVAWSPTLPALPNSAAPSPNGPASDSGPSLGLVRPANGASVPPVNLQPSPALSAALPTPGPANNLPPANNPPSDNNPLVVPNANNTAVAGVSPNPPSLPATPSQDVPALNPPTNMAPANAMPGNNLPMNAAANAAPKNIAQPPLGLDGFCPVTLAEKQQWVPGDKRWGVLHQGRTYLFAGPEEQSRFLGNFDRYAPINSGLDIVLSADEHKSVPGMREHGVFFKDRVFLFANEATLQKFSTNPYYYLDQAQLASRQVAPTGQQPR